MNELLTPAAAVVTALLLALAFYWRLRPKAHEPASVLRLWHARLPEFASSAFEQIVFEANSSFAMFSVALDEALSARRDEERLVRPLLTMSAKLLERFQSEMEVLTGLVLDSSRPLHRLPEVPPLQAENFRTAAAVGLTRRLALLHTILLSRRMRFFQKLADIDRVGRRLAEAYQEAAGRAPAGGPGADSAWETLDAVQYDLNTLWQESQIAFKSILHFVPEPTAAALPARFQIELARREAAARPVPRTSQPQPR